MAKSQEKFRNHMYVTAFKLATTGLSDTQIAKNLGVSYITFRGWLRKDPDLARAVEEGRQPPEPVEEITFHEYVFQHISPELRTLWEQITAVEGEENQYERVEALLRTRGHRVRQRLFIHALTKTNFNISRSLRMVGITKRTYDGWRTKDPEFIELVDEINFHQQNFYINAFNGRVSAGDTTAIIHAVKTMCADRGYNDKVQLEVSGTVQHEHVVDLSVLDLDVNTRKAILEALRAHKAAQEETKAIQYAQVVGN